MRLESALFSSTAGLTANGQAISVVGDNIANSNTVGYKTSAVEFSDLFSEGDGGIQSSENKQVGSGVQVTAVKQMHNDGILEFTGKQLDVAISGPGFFTVGDPTDPRFSRAGNFAMDRDGFLVTSSGESVLGFGPEGEELQAINLLDLELESVATTEGAIVGNLDSGSEIGEGIPADFVNYTALNQAANFVSSATIYDSLGASHEVSLAFFKTDVNTWSAQAYIDGGSVGGDPGVPVAVSQELELAFGNDGLLPVEAREGAVLNLDIPFAEGAAPSAIAMDLSAFSQFGATSSINSFTQNGTGVGSVSSYDFRQDGSIVALVSNGEEVTLGRIALAYFNNSEGLTRVGNGMYTASETSGEARIEAIEDSSPSQIEGGAVELSTVDISKQFTDMILFQRGYQASSQVFRTAGDMVRDTIQQLLS